MELSYLLTPLLGYLLAGGFKFAINSVKLRRWAFSNIGMGGMPSTHNTIASSTFFSIGFGEGFYSPITAVAFAVSFLVCIDSLDLRHKIEEHAKILSDELGNLNENAKNLRTRIGHSVREVLAGWLLGGVIGYSVFMLLG